MSKLVSGRLADVPAAQTGTGLGLYQGIAGGGALVAGIWAGLAWNGTGRIPLVVAGVVAGALAVWLAYAGSSRYSPPPRDSTQISPAAS